MDDNTNQNNQDLLLKDTPPLPLSSEPTTPADSPVPQDTDQIQEDRYKKILEEYTQQVGTSETEPVLKEPKLPHQVPSDPMVSTPMPPVINQEPVIEPVDLPLPVVASTPIQSDTSQNNSDIKNPSKFNLFKYLFYISTLIFMIILGLLVKDYLKLQKLTKSLEDTSSIDSNSNFSPETPTPLVDISSVCTLNDIEYTIGESFSAEDGCNTCECQQTENGPQIICTLLDCGDSVKDSDDQTK